MTRDPEQDHCNKKTLDKGQDQDRKKREEKAAFVLQKKHKLLTRDISRTSPALRATCAAVLPAHLRSAD